MTKIRQSLIPKYDPENLNMTKNVWFIQETDLKDLEKS